MAERDELPHQAAGEVADGAPSAMDWHLLLLGLAGRLSDTAIVRCRILLADGDAAALGEGVLTAILAEAVSLFGVEIDFLDDAMAWRQDVDERLSRIAVTEHGYPLGYKFTADHREDGTVGAADRAAIVTSAGLAGAIGLWRSHRVPIGTRSGQITPVYVVEAEEDADLMRMTVEIQGVLAAVGLADPQVEVYPSGSELPSYHRLARAHGALLWSRTGDPGVQIAVLFDEVDPTHGPRFREDHPTIDEQEWPKLVGYLKGCEPLLLTTARLPDVVDSTRGKLVPASFRTDGTWVWSDATTYYLEEHRLTPDPALVAHIRSLSHIPPIVDDVGRHRAMTALRKPSSGEPG